MLIAFNKPFGVLCKFGSEPGRRTLADFIPIKNVYPAGRLDIDSEGLLLLTDNGALQARISNPRDKLPKVYWAQVEGEPTEAALLALRGGMRLSDFTTKPTRASSRRPIASGRASHRFAIERRFQARGSS